MLLETVYFFSNSGIIIMQNLLLSRMMNDDISNSSYTAFPN